MILHNAAEHGLEQVIIPVCQLFLFPGQLFLFPGLPFQAYPGLHFLGDIPNHTDADLPSILRPSLFAHIVNPDITAVLFPHPVLNLVVSALIKCL